MTKSTYACLPPSQNEGRGTREHLLFQYESSVTTMSVLVEPRFDALEIRTKLKALNLHLNTPEPLIICRVCKYALQPTGRRVLKHL
jgi:hypothetical protein